MLLCHLAQGYPPNQIDTGRKHTAHSFSFTLKVLVTANEGNATLSTELLKGETGCH